MQACWSLPLAEAPRTELFMIYGAARIPTAERRRNSRRLCPESILFIIAQLCLSARVAAARVFSSESSKPPQPTLNSPGQTIRDSRHVSSALPDQIPDVIQPHGPNWYHTLPRTQAENRRVRFPGHGHCGTSRLAGLWRRSDNLILGRCCCPPSTWRPPMPRVRGN